MTAELPRPRAILPFGGTQAFFQTELRVQLHEWMPIVTSMIVQAVLLIFVTILAPSYLGVALLGALVFSFFALGQRVLNEAAYIRIDHKLNQLYLASPLRPEGYFLGLALGVLVAYLAPILVLSGITIAYLRPSLLTIGVLAGSCTAVWLFSSSLGYALSTRFRDMRAIWSYASILYNVFGVLPPVFYPYSLFPPALRPIALVLPPSGASGLLQETLSPGTLSSGEIVLATASLIVTTVGAFALAAYWARRTVKEN